MKMEKKNFLKIFSPTSNPDIHANREASSPPEKSSNIKISSFMLFGDHFDLPRSGSEQLHFVSVILFI
jgi:hypothetical protein